MIDIIGGQKCKIHPFYIYIFSQQGYNRKAPSLCDDFLFTKTMQDPDILKPILEAILNFKISQVKIADAQKSFDVSYDSHGIRLDVYADDAENSRFAVEMQARREYNLFDIITVSWTSTSF